MPGKLRSALQTSAASFAAAAILSACGGGSGSSPAGNVASGAVASGVVAAGAPVAGATLLAIGPNGQNCGSATTNSQGAYTMSLSCSGAPVVLSLLSGGPGGIPLDAVYLPAGGGQALPASFTVNVDPLTTLIAYDALGKLGVNASSNLQVVALSSSLMTGSAYAAATQSVLGALAPVLANYGVQAANFDPVSSPYPSPGTGVDALFDTYPESAPNGTSVELGSASSPLLQVSLPATAGAQGTLSGSAAQLGSADFPYAGYTVYAVQTQASAAPGQPQAGAGQVAAASATQGSLSLGSQFLYLGARSLPALPLTLSTDPATQAAASDGAAAPMLDPGTNGGVVQICQPALFPGALLPTTTAFYIAVANGGSGNGVSSHFLPLSTTAQIYATIGGKPLFAMFNCAYSAGSSAGTATPSTSTNDYATITSAGNLLYNALGASGNPVLDVPAANIDLALTPAGAPIASNGSFTFPGNAQTTASSGREYWHAWSFVDPLGQSRVLIIKQLMFNGASAGLGIIEAYISQ